MPEAARLFQSAKPHRCLATSVAYLPPNEAMALHHWAVSGSAPGASGPPLKTAAGGGGGGGAQARAEPGAEHQEANNP